jgi:hypothetical protein
MNSMRSACFAISSRGQTWGNSTLRFNAILPISG